MSKIFEIDNNRNLMTNKCPTMFGIENHYLWLFRILYSTKHSNIGDFSPT